MAEFLSKNKVLAERRGSGSICREYFNLGLKDPDPKCHLPFPSVGTKLMQPLRMKANTAERMARPKDYLSLRSEKQCYNVAVI